MLTRRSMLLLDIDGTLLELAPTRNQVVVPHDLVALLREFSGVLDGALAIVSGRPLAEIDHLLRPLSLAGAGLHGAELRRFGSARIVAQAGASGTALASMLRERVGGIEGVEVEDKGAAVALHYRRAPGHADDCVAAMTSTLSSFPGLRMLHGHCVVEAVPHGVDKGLAIAQLTECPLFADRVPVFVGDDVTDEDGFAQVQRRGGVGIKVGPGATLAVHRLIDVRAVYEWLRADLKALQSGQ